MNVARETTNKALVIVALDTPFNERETIASLQIMKPLATHGRTHSSNFVERQRASPVLVRTLGEQIC
jgi:hypothetical protein